MNFLKLILSLFEYRKNKKTRIVVDEKTIQSNDIQSIIEPLWWSVSIYDGEEQYEKGLWSFSLPQRHVFAIQWYIAEINNGGHNQFYYNSTGIVWEDVLEGFEAIKAVNNTDILRKSADRIGGIPSKDRDVRQEQLEVYSPDFDDLDTLYYESEAELVKLIIDYIKNNPTAFYFQGEVVIPQG